MARRTHTRRTKRTVASRTGRAVWFCVGSVWTFLATLALGGAIVMLVAWKVYGLVPVAVISGSMEPTLPVRSLIFVKEVPPEKVDVGDIITFDAPGEKVGRVTHRVVKTSTHNGAVYFETKGDANKHRDDWRRFLPQPSAPVDADPATATKPGNAPAGQPSDGHDGHDHPAATTAPEWMPGVSYGDRPAVRYVWGVPYLGRVVELSDRPRLRLTILLGILGLMAITMLARIWTGSTAKARAPRRPAHQRPAIAGSAASVIQLRPLVSVPVAASDPHEPRWTPAVAIAVRRSELVVRLREQDSVVEVRRVLLPTVAAAADRTITSIVVSAYNDVSASLDGRWPQALPADGGVVVSLGPIGDIIGKQIGGAALESEVDRNMVGNSIRDLVASMVADAPADPARLEQLAQLIALDATLDHLGVTRATLTTDADASGRARAARVAARRLSSGSAAVVAVLAFSLVGMSSAILTDAVSMAAVNVTGGQLLPIGSMSFVSSSGATTSNLRTSWTTPAGIPPSSYDFWRSTTAGVSTAGAPTVNLATSPWDVDLTQCSPYYYKSKSRFANMVSAESAEFSWMHDGTLPVVNSTYAVSIPTGIDPFGDWIGPSSSFYLYANITDNCAAADSLTVTFDTSAIAAGGSTTAPATFGAFTPIGASPSYNFRIGPLTAKAGLIDGAQVPWSATVTTPALYHSQVTTTAGDTPTFDSTAPSVSRTPVLVADVTNYYAPEIGSGAVPKNRRFRLVGGFADNTGGSGLSTAAGGIVADINTLATTASVSLSASGAPFSTENGVNDWTHRTATGGSAPLVKNPLANGNYAISIVTQDQVGNATTSSISGRVDSTQPTLSACTDVNGGTSARLDAGDLTRLDFSEPMDPGSIVPAWTDGAASFPGLRFKVWDASFLGLGVVASDFVEYEGTTIQASANQGDDYVLGSSQWVTSIFASGFALFNNGTIDRVAGQSGQRWDLKYLGTSAPSLARPTGVDAPVNESFRLRTTGAGTWDVAGNNVSTASIACATSPW